MVDNNKRYFLSMHQFKEKEYKKILFIASILSFFTKLWLEDVGLMESRNFISAREIISSGDWLVTTLNGYYRFEKPPLPTWTAAAIMKIAGNVDQSWLFRIPSALLSMWIVFLMYKFVKRLSEDNFLSFMSALILSTTFMIQKEGIINTWDIFSYGFMFASTVYLTEGLKTSKRSDFMKFGLCFAGSLMSKGPVAPYALLLPFLISYGVVYGAKEYKKNKTLIIKGLILAVIVALIWPVCMLINNSDLFLAVLEKEQETWDSKSVRGYFYYIDYSVYTGGWLMFLVYSLFDKSLKNKISLSHGKILKMSFLWSLISFVFISVIKMKKQRYGLPLYIVSAIPSGILCSYLYRSAYDSLSKWDKYLLKIQEWIIKIALIAAPILLIVKSKFRPEPIVIVLIIFYSLLARGSFYVLKKYKKETAKILVIGTAGLMLIVNSTLVWFIYQQLLCPPHDKKIKYLKTISKLDKKIEIYSTGIRIEDVWKVGRKVIIIDDVEKNQNRILNVPDKFLLLSEYEEELEGLKNYSNIKDYKIEKVESYYRNVESKKFIKLYEIRIIK